MATSGLCVRIAGPRDTHHTVPSPPPWAPREGISLSNLFLFLKPFSCFFFIKLEAHSRTCTPPPGSHRCCNTAPQLRPRLRLHEPSALHCFSWSSVRFICSAPMSPFFCGFFRTRKPFFNPPFWWIGPPLPRCFFTFFICPTPALCYTAPCSIIYVFPP